MNDSIGIWNTLHDGEITVVEIRQGTVTMFVSIPYLRERLKPNGDSFILKLKGTKKIQFLDFDGEPKSDKWQDLAKNGIEILSTDSKEMPVRVITTMGFLDLDFEKLEIQLDTGAPTSYEDVRRACKDYWEEWSRK
ncbi:MAG: hypothetical protein AAGJ81_10160 [Verrucomicrobiota bacterium]